jgi:hypothetical protein
MLDLWFTSNYLKVPGWYPTFSVPGATSVARFLSFDGNGLTGSAGEEPQLNSEASNFARGIRVATDNTRAALIHLTIQSLTVN